MNWLSVLFNGHSLQHSLVDGNQSTLLVPQERQYLQRGTPLVQITGRVSSRSWQTVEGTLAKVQPCGTLRKPAAPNGTAPTISLSRNPRTETALTAPATARPSPPIPSVLISPCHTTLPAMWLQNLSNWTISVNLARQGRLTSDLPSGSLLTRVKQVMRCFAQGCFKNPSNLVLVFQLHPT